MTDESANKPKRKAPHSAWKPGQSGNPAGAPPRGESWAELFTNIGNMTGEQAAKFATKILAPKLRKLPEGVTLKELVVVKTYTELLDKIPARLLKETMDRAEGKAAQSIDITSKGESVVPTVIEIVKKYDE